MSITPITTDQLRRIQDHDGLILQGCGGSLQEWQDGINHLLTEIGILKNGSRFENIHVFQNEGRTCLLFPFTDDVQIDMGKLAIWRLQSHDQFEGIWLSDYVDLRLGGPLQEQQHNKKPDCPLIGADSNIFNIIGIASRTLKEYGMQEQAKEMRQRIDQCHSYDSALSIIMDKHREDPKDIGAKAKAEKYAKILAKTIINPEGDGTDRGQNAYFYDSAEGLLASVVLLLAEFLPPEETGGYEMRHIASVFKLVQELLMQSSSRRGGNQFQELMSLLPADHKAKWLAGSALTASDQGMNSIMSTVLSKLNAFLDTELEQVICFDGSIDAELFVKEKCAIFLILPEEDATKNFVASLMIQNLARELFSVANEHGGKLPNRAVFFCDELGTMPPFDILPLFSAGRSRRLTLVPIIQSLAQLEKNYGKEGSEIMCDNCQDTIFGGFAPNSQTANTLSGNLGSRTVLSGTVTKGKNDDSQSLQMMERPLMSPDELKSMPKGNFVVMKTGTHPMKTKLKLFFEWGIQFQKPLEMPDRGSRPVYYAGKQDLERSILSQFPMIHMPMGATMPSRVQQASKPMPENTSIKTSTE